MLAIAVGPRRLGVVTAGFAALSFAGLTWIYILTPNDVASFLSTNGNRIVVSLVVALGALAPLLVEESVQRLSPSRAELTPDAQPPGSL